MAECAQHRTIIAIPELRSKGATPASELGVTDESKQLIRGLLGDGQSGPQGTLFDDDIFVDVHDDCGLSAKGRGLPQGALRTRHGACRPRP